jgi:hypothetical protein
MTPLQEIEELRAKQKAERDKASTESTKSGDLFSKK